MTHRKSSGTSVVITASTDIIAGTIVVSGSLVGVAPYSIASGDEGVIDRKGEYAEVPYDGAAAVTLGGVAYYNTTSGCVTATSSGNTEIGIFSQAVSSGGATCTIILD